MSLLPKRAARSPKRARSPEVRLNIADVKLGHRTETLTVERALELYPFQEASVVAVDGIAVRTAKEFGAELSRLVDEARTQIEVDVLPQVAGG